MGNLLIAALEGNKIVTRTENGALTNSTSGSRLLDLFAQGGALRTRSESSVESLFRDAFNEDKALAVKTAFYLRDIRGGQGERKTFRIILNWLAFNEPAIVRKNLANVAEYGRWDDLFTLFGTPVEKDMVKLVQTQVVDDLKSDRPSLLGKWLPSINAGKASAKLANRIRKALKLTPAEYRRVTSNLRGKIQLVEQKMCGNQWGTIDYETIPSRAALIYRKAFRKRDETRYQQYLDEVTKGNKTIKTATLYPYDIVRIILKYGGYGYYNLSGYRGSDVATLDAQWNNLPDYLKDNPHNGIAMVDVSGSMMDNDGLPMATSISLGIYLAERNKGAFHNKYITFTGHPKLQTVPSGTIADKVSYIRRTDVGYNTNIQAAFDMILTTAVANRVPQSDMPDTIYIISDMEFDSGDIGGRKTNYETIKQKYARSGYDTPRLVFWNVNARNDQSPVTVRDDGVVLVSGSSPSIFTNLLAGKNMDALSIFLSTVNAERYNAVVV